jgi:hypothetical protein
MREMNIELPCGRLNVAESMDPDYPGVDVELESSADDECASRPRVLIEYTEEDENVLRVLVWANKDDEDYTHQIILRDFKK